ncbi:MAG: dihydroorotate dehydrogenase electron transfer subunit [Candidatus Omnitrophica bacterium]|nr:dihydroorotate dehydrogenase electron transfer subunit [Candidatus Omnitrophota bacterium]
MRNIKARVIYNNRVSAGFYGMSIRSAYLAENTRPGQFFEVKCPDGSGTFLRRPLGAHRIHKDGVEMLYEVVGKGTAALSGMKAGQELDIIGPLGNGFKIDRTKDKNSEAILVAGGIGVAPLVALAEALAARKERKIQVFIGAKTKSHILCEKEFKKFGCEARVSTEDGSKGTKGFITEKMDVYLSAKRYPLNAKIYACGPDGMLKAVAGIAEKYGMQCQISMEERMACGVGVCLGCPVKTKGALGYKMVCKDGPVFDTREIAW